MSNTWRKKGAGWEQVGVDWGNAKPIEIWHRDGNDHVVFKIPGGKHWSSILAPSVSHPGLYVVAKIIEDRGDILITEQLFEMPLSKRGGS